ncbi:MAG: Isopenicillin N epimerase [Planctomycetes bacterium ADurb.Bin412]|nr:MAG: Isopenicillin N epimerase [Planctomycetes bacterium ADurb.Bin412]
MRCPGKRMTKAKNLKRLFLLKPRITFLNHGSFGATPRPVFQAYQNWQKELERQPVEFLGRRHNHLMRDARAALAGYLGTAAENIVYTQNVTISLNMAARSLKLGPGDEVLSTQHEYGAVDRMWRFLAGEQGFSYIRQEIRLPLETKDLAAEDFWRGVTDRTRVICLSHITSPTAMILPVEEIVAKARQKGILTVIDGAHGPGQIPLNLDRLDPDFYGGNLHKWLMAPKGSGFLYARPSAQALLKPLVVSWGKELPFSSGCPFIDDNEWLGTRDVAAFLAVPEAIRFQADHDWDTVREECHRLAAKTQAEICRLTGMPPLHSRADGWFAQMFAAPLPGETNLDRLKERLYKEYQIEVPLIEWNDWKLIRVSVQGYNTPADMKRLLTALEKLLPG